MEEAGGLASPGAPSPPRAALTPGDSPSPDPQGPGDLFQLTDPGERAFFLEHIAAWISLWVSTWKAPPGPGPDQHLFLQPLAQPHLPQSSVSLQCVLEVSRFLVYYYY